jgi:hypothetical protein
MLYCQTPVQDPQTLLLCHEVAANRTMLMIMAYDDIKLLKS